MANTQSDLEQKIFLAVSQFCKDTNQRYCILMTSQDSISTRTLQIIVGEYDPSWVQGIKTKFQHAVYLKDGKMINNQTESVDQTTAARSLYTRFIDNLRLQGLELTNQFEKLWKSRPDQYPI